MIQIIAFYEFKELLAVGPLVELRLQLKQALHDLDVRGTIILADEGYNGMMAVSAASVNR